MRNITPTRPADPTKIEFYTPVTLIVHEAAPDRSRAILTTVWLFQICVWGASLFAIVGLGVSVWWLVPTVMLSTYGNSGWFEKPVSRLVANLYGD